MKKIIITAWALVPTLAFAQYLGNVENLFRAIGRVIGVALPVVVGLALLTFFWGLVKFIFAQGDENSKADAKRIMLWGLIALFVMVSVWGLIKFITDAFQISQIDTITAPKVQNL